MTYLNRNSRDTILFIVKEVYAMYGIHYTYIDQTVSAVNKLQVSLCDRIFLVIKLLIM